jgi:hypothetical protein
MKTLLFSLRCGGALALALFAFGCTNAQQNTDNMLATAGFRNVLASTPQQKQLLASLPADKMSTVQKDGKTWYVFPNQATNSAMVGTPAQFATYRQMLSAQRMSDRNLMAAQQSRTIDPRWGGPGWGGTWGGPWGWR